MTLPETSTEDAPCWFVMRDLKRSNAALPAYRQLDGQGFEVFTPMKWTIAVRKGCRERREVPFMQDLLFVHSSRRLLDPVVQRTPTLQYRYLRGAAYCTPMTVETREMERFIHAVRATESPRYYRPEELTPTMYGRRIRLIGGPLHGIEGHLLSLRGSRSKRLLLELRPLLCVSVEVEPEFIRFV